MVLYYKATVYFPENFKQIDLNSEKEPNIDYDTVSFIRNDCLIYAEIKPWVIPHELSDNKYVQSEIIKPTIEKVVADIQTVENLFDELRKHEECLCYAKDIGIPLFFKVYNLMEKRKCDPFKKLITLKNVPRRLLKKEYQDLVGIAEFVDQEEGKVPHVQGLNLRDAVEKALTIYNMAERLKEIYFVNLF